MGRKLNSHVLLVFRELDVFMVWASIRQVHRYKFLDFSVVIEQHISRSEKKSSIIRPFNLELLKSSKTDISVYQCSINIAFK